MVNIETIQSELDSLRVNYRIWDNLQIKVAPSAKTNIETFHVNGTEIICPPSFLEQNDETRAEVLKSICIEYSLEKQPKTFKTLVRYYQVCLWAGRAFVIMGMSLILYVAYQTVDSFSYDSYFKLVHVNEVFGLGHLFMGLLASLILFTGEQLIGICSKHLSTYFYNETRVSSENE